MSGFSKPRLRAALVAGAAFAACVSVAAPAASAQQIASAPLAQVDPWSVGWLGRADGALSNTIWSDTDAATLAPLFADLKPFAMSPAARAVLRRVLLSAARPPSGEPDLLPERLRLLEQSGEGARAADLRRRFAQTEWGKTGERFVSELDLAAGHNETACARVAQRRADDAVWLRVRALCLAIAKDFDAAAIVVEQALQQEDNADGWLLSAIETMREPLRTKPQGRYGSAFEAAVSVAAGLATPGNAFASTPADVAAAVAQHGAASPDQKRAALRVAVDAGRLNAEQTLAVVEALLPKEAAAPRAGAPRTATDFLNFALAAREAEEPSARAAAYAAALKAADSATDARIAALALSAAIRTLPKTEDTVVHAEPFARAALLAGDVRQARDWRGLMDNLPDDKVDIWASSRIDLMLSFAANDEKNAREILETLLDSVPAAPATAPRSPTAAQRQAELRRIENTRILFLYVGAGRSLPPAARATLGGQRTAGRGVPDAALARIQAAAEGSAGGEALIGIVGQLGPDVSALSFAGLADLLTLLRRLTFEKEADAVALEALQVWKAL